MKRIKKSLLALAAFCAITANANAYTFSDIFYYPTIPEFTVTFSKQTVSTELPETSGKCKFCWFSDCWEYDYIFDGVRTIFVDKVGIYFLFTSRLNDTKNSIWFDKVTLPACIHCNDR